MIVVDYSILIAKMALDKNSLKLGKIINITDLPGKTIKKLKPYVVIQVKQGFLKKPITINIEAEKRGNLRAGQTGFVRKACPEQKLDFGMQADAGMI